SLSGDRQEAPRPLWAGGRSLAVQCTRRAFPLQDLTQGERHGTAATAGLLSAAAHGSVTGGGGHRLGPGPARSRRRGAAPLGRRSALRISLGPAAPAVAPAPTWPLDAPGRRRGGLRGVR